MVRFCYFISILFAALTGQAQAANPCSIVRIMDEGPRLTGTRTTIVCVATQRTHLFEDGSDYEWSYVRIDGQWIAIPPDTRVGTWNP